MRVFLCSAAAACVLLSAGSNVVTAGAERGSPALVKQLVSAMGARQLDAIAAPYRGEPGRFIAALVYPDVQLLLVSSRHESPELMASLINRKQFREVYIALQNGQPEGRMFIHDMGCDGVREDTGDFDVFYEGAARRTIFDGNWAAQSLTEAAYVEKHAQADERYSRVLTLLLDAVKRLPIDPR